MTREKIEGAKEVVIPYIMEELRHYNVDGNGEADAEEARKDLEEIFGLAIKALEQEPTTKNDLGVDCISRAEAIKCLECDFDITGKENMKTVVNYINSAHDKIVNLPRVKQEPFKPMVEIDLDYVIKQKYIEREVLDKIYADIQRLRGCSCSCSDGIIDDVEDILDKYKAESEEA